MKPAVGRIVHYYAPRYAVAPHLGGQPDKVALVPAIIEEVHTDELVNLRALGGDEFGQKFTSVRVADHDDCVPNTWAWPPRV